ncbi:hypothetical protein NFI96_011558, partial [Prochilodus magdalenae]
ASSFSFCRPAVEYKALPEDFKYQLSRCTGGNLTWHEGRGHKTAGGRTVKLLQQPGTEGLQVSIESLSELLTQKYSLIGHEKVRYASLVGIWWRLLWWVTAGRVQVVKETLSSQLPDLCGGLFPSRHYRIKGSDMPREREVARVREGVISREKAWNAKKDDKTVVLQGCGLKRLEKQQEQLGGVRG